MNGISVVILIDERGWLMIDHTFLQVTTPFPSCAAALLSYHCICLQHNTLENVIFFTAWHGESGTMCVICVLRAVSDGPCHINNPCNCYNSSQGQFHSGVSLFWWYILVINRYCMCVCVSCLSVCVVTVFKSPCSPRQSKDSRGVDMSLPNPLPTCCSNLRVSRPNTKPHTALLSSSERAFRAAAV